MKKLIILDIVFYMILPFILWNTGREPLGDYYAMLLSTVPGLLYTVFRFMRERQFNVGGLFIILSLLVSTLMNVLSGNANDMLWNQVYLGFFYAFVHLLSIVLRRPFAMYFAADFAYLQGQPRNISINLFASKGIFKWFQVCTGLMAVRSVFLSSLKAYLIHSYGVDGYGNMLIYMKSSGWIFDGILLLSLIFIYSKVQAYVKRQEEGRPAET